MKKNLDIGKFRDVLTQAFPKIKLGIGYGSAFFQQKNYDYTKPPILDLIFVVDDRKQWHAENMKSNRSHYGGLSYLFGASFIDTLQRMFSPIHYNPFVKVDEYLIKYGVISADDFKRDLNDWETLVVAGRMHKPVMKVIEQEENSDDTIQKNLQSAISTALLLDMRSAIKDKELFLNIVSLSYVGDIRFAIKGENANKMMNIVDGQYSQLKELYFPLLKEPPFSKIVKLDESGLIFTDFSNENRHRLIEMLPIGLSTDIAGDFHQSLFMRKDEQREILKDALSDINSRVSRNMLLYHLFTVSPWKNFKYAFSKLSKGFAKK